MHRLPPKLHCSLQNRLRLPVPHQDNHTPRASSKAKAPSYLSSPPPQEHRIAKTPGIYLLPLWKAKGHTFSLNPHFTGFLGNLIQPSSALANLFQDPTLIVHFLESPHHLQAV